VSGNEHERLDAASLPEQTAEIELLPDLAERRETLKRANQALERALELLEHLRSLEAKLQAPPTPVPPSEPPGSQHPESNLGGN
jgi:predicted RNase H-like HicB family nuclease